MSEHKLIDRCLGMNGFVRCPSPAEYGQVYCKSHLQLKNAGQDFYVCIAPLSEFYGENGEKLSE